MVEGLSESLLLISNLCAAIVNYWTTVIALLAVTSLAFVPLTNSSNVYALVTAFLTVRTLMLLVARFNLITETPLHVLDLLGGRVRLSKFSIELLSKSARKSPLIQLALTAAATFLIALSLIIEDHIIIKGLLITAIVVINAGILYVLIEPADVALSAALWSLGSIAYAISELYFANLPLVYAFSVIVMSDVFAVLGLNAKGIVRCVTAASSRLK